MTSNGEQEVLTKCHYCGDTMPVLRMYRKYHDVCRVLARRAQQADWYQDKKSLKELKEAEIYWQLGEIRSHLVARGWSLEDASARARKLVLGKP